VLVCHFSDLGLIADLVRPEEYHLPSLGDIDAHENDY
jgi:hypothetical protein